LFTNSVAILISIWRITLATQVKSEKLEVKSGNWGSRFCVLGQGKRRDSSSRLYRDSSIIVSCLIPCNSSGWVVQCGQYRSMVSAQL